MRAIRVFSIVGLLGLIGAVSASAQTGTVVFDFPVSAGATPAGVQAWTARLYVNGTAFVLNDTCVVGAVVPVPVITCTAALPNITAALTASGSQTFTASLADGILESAVSVPLVLVRPSAPTAPRIQ